MFVVQGSGDVAQSREELVSLFLAVHGVQCGENVCVCGAKFLCGHVVDGIGVWDVDHVVSPVLGSGRDLHSLSQRTGGLKDAGCTE